ncbi:MAG TPA: TOBE domain-containing protein, partial [Pseudonocardiaceae bacterium]|nr:TOBE domain-containing protein [Pseudonocardiaceae bacterium]
EAMTMGHRVAVLKDGLLQQCDTPRALYDHPANAFVAGFIGSPGMNLKTVPLTSNGAKLDGTVVELPRDVLSAASAQGLSEITFGVRPETLRLASIEEEGFDLSVELVEELGADAYVHGAVQIGDHSERFVVRVDGRTPPTIGQKVKVALRDAAEIHLFHPETGARLTD